MSVQMMMGFDGFSGAFSGTQNAANPNLVGIEPFVDTYGITFQGGGSVNATAGVTGRAEDKMSHGGNSLVINRSTTAYRPKLSLPGTAIGSLPGREMRVDLAFRYTIGFRFKVSAESAAHTGGISFLGSNLTATVLTLTSGSGPYTLLFMNLALSPNILLEQGREYYFEVVCEHDGINPGGSNYNPVWTLFIDGVEIASRNTLAVSSSVTNWLGYDLGTWISTTSSTTNQQRYLYSDIYVTDHRGEAPYNGRLGPQRVRAVWPDEVVESSWVPSEGTDPLPLVGEGTKDDDTTYITAPADEGSSSYRFGFPFNAGSVVNGLMVIARAKRESGAIRPLQGRIVKADGTTQIGDNLAPSMDVVYKDYVVASVFPENAAEAQDLRSSVLDNAIVKLNAPVV